MHTKQCSKCKNNKTLDNFNKKSKSKDGLSSYCKDCNKTQLKQHYYNNRKYYYNKSKSYNEKLRRWLSDYKKHLSCKVCGENRWWVLDFHHRNPKTKDGNINKLLMYNGKKKVLQEIEKCDVLCSNCHRDLHYKLKLNGDFS